MDAKQSFPYKQKPICNIRPGQELYCKNGETVIVRNIINDDIIVEYKRHYYQRSLPDCFNRSLFLQPYNPTAHYYDYYGYDDDGYDQNGYDKEGFNRNGFTQDGFDRNGYSQDGFDRNGFDRSGYDRDGFNRKGFNRQGYNKDGFDRKGYDKDGFNAYGFDNKGYDRSGYDMEGNNKAGYTWIDEAKLLKDGDRRTIFGNLCCNRGLILKCKDCHTEFVFEFGEYKFFLQHGFDNPKRCPPCRQKNKKDQEKFGGYKSTMQQDATRKQTGRQLAYLHSQPIDE